MTSETVRAEIVLNEDTKAALLAEGRRGAAERHRGMINTLLGLAVSSEATRSTAEALDHLYMARVLLDAWERRLRANQGPATPPTENLTRDEAAALAAEVFPDR